MHAQSPGRGRLSVTPWTVAHQAPLSMGSSRQEHWSGLPGPPDQGLNLSLLRLLSWQEGSLALMEQLGELSIS